ncbi:MAG: serine hydrolase [Nocardioidaceae bacterium]
MTRALTTSRPPVVNLAAAVRAYVATRGGTVSFAMRDSTTGRTVVVGQHRVIAASAIKLSILEALLDRAQADQRELTEDEKSLAAEMIENSNNDAATALWSELGAEQGMVRFWAKLRMTHTLPGPPYYWGLTTTTASDQLKVLGALAGKDPDLAPAEQQEADELLDQVEADQRWGVSGGVPASVTVRLKDGWLPRPHGWVVNSIGHVRGQGHDYLIAVLTSGSRTEAHGIDTIEHLSRLTWQHES